METRIQKTALFYALAGMFVLFFSFTAIGQPETSIGLEYPGAQKDLSTAKATVKAYQEGNWENLRANLKEDAIIYGLGNYDSLNVDETISYWIKGRKAATPTLAEDETWITARIAEGPQKGNWVFHWGINTLTYEDGEKITFPYHVSMRMEDNKVAETHFYYDNMKIIRKMGYAISPPLEEEPEDELLLE